MGMHKSTTGRLLKKYSETGIDTPNKKGVDQRSKLIENHKLYIRSLVDEDCTISLDAIANKILDNYNVVVCKQAISNCLNKFRYTLKKFQFFDLLEIPQSV